MINIIGILGLIGYNYHYSRTLSANLFVICYEKKLEGE